MSRRLILLSLMQPPWPALFAASASGHALSVILGSTVELPSFCGSDITLALAVRPTEAVAMALFLNPLGSLLGSWTLMLLAMMPPLVCMALVHVWESTVRRHRSMATASFVLGYFGIWMVAAFPLGAMSLWLQVTGGTTVAIGVFAAAMAWSASPWQRKALNQGHRLRRISALGWRANADALQFGMVHGVWCLGACWPWMLFATVADRWHTAAMVLSSVAVLFDRLSTPGRVRWHLPPQMAWAIPARILRSPTAVSAIA